MKVTLLGALSLHTNKLSRLPSVPMRVVADPGPAYITRHTMTDYTCQCQCQTQQGIMNSIVGRTRPAVSMHVIIVLMS
jgi:hypothetical protein